MFVSEKLIHGYNSLLAYFNQIEEIVYNEGLTEADRIKDIKNVILEASRPLDEKKVNK
jgi:hypothetical protein